MKRIVQRGMMLILTAIALCAQGQNLLQNPDFESPDGWDDRWILSLTDPSSSSAVASANSSDVYEGNRSVLLSNLVKLKWTYFYSDSTNAPITLRANKKYEVSGWIKVLEMGKELDFSIFWDSSQQVVQFYAENPDPAMQPDWFQVKDTIYPLVHCSDAYLRLGFRSEKDGLFPAGKLLMDHFSVTRIPEITDTDILQFLLPGQSMPAVIDYVTGTVHIELEAGSDPRALLPELIEVSSGATITPSAAEKVDFTASPTYLVTAEDGLTTQVWNVEVLVAPSRETEMVEFSIPGESAPAKIDPSLRLVSVEMPFGTDLTSLVPLIGISEGATVDPAAGSVVDFTDPVLFTVTAEDRVTTQEWTVEVTMTAPSAEAQIIRFGLDQQIGTTEMNTTDRTIAVVMPFGFDVTALVPDMEISAGASADPPVGTPVDLSSLVTYAVTAEDGNTLLEWTVRVGFAPNNAANILGFSIDGLEVTPVIDPADHTVTCEVPCGTNVASLVPTAELSAGAVIDPPIGGAVDFSSPVIYTVTAQDGTTQQEWTVQVIILPNTEAEIIRFSLEEQTEAATIDQAGQAITLEVHSATDLTALSPRLELSPGAVSDPPGGRLTDFTSPVVYTVTAEDGVTSKQWVVTVLKEVVATGVNGLDMKRMSVYPNPADGFLVVEFTGQGEILMQDLHGRTVLTLSGANERAELSVSGLERGIYFVTVSTAAGREVSRVILE